MRRVSGITAVLGAVLLSATVIAQTGTPARPAGAVKVPTEAEYSQLMKDIQAAQQSLRKSVDAKTAAAGAADAQKLHDGFVQVEAFWKQRNVEDAVKSSTDAVQAAAKAVAATKADNAEDLSAGFTAMGAQCRTCHTAHRERLPDGTYKIK